MSNTASDKDLLSPSDYQMALHAQSACNLSGIVISFADVMKKICTEAAAKGHGTEWKNKHPIARLYAEQISHLTGGGMTSDEASYARAYAECSEQALQAVR